LDETRLVVEDDDLKFSTEVTEISCHRQRFANEVAYDPGEQVLQILILVRGEGVDHSQWQEDIDRPRSVIDSCPVTSDHR